MSEEPILTKDEPVDQTVENIVPFTSEAAESSSPVSEANGSAKENPASSAASADIFEKAIDLTNKAVDLTSKATETTGKAFQKAASQIMKESEEETFPEDDVPVRKHFHFRKGDKEFFRDKWILSRISDENLMEYLTLEQRRSELQQEAKNVKEKRIFRAFALTIALAAIVAVIYLLRDNPSILVNILYIAGILGAFWVWKNPHEK